MTMPALNQNLLPIASTTDRQPLFPGRLVGGAQPSPSGLHIGHYFNFVREYRRLQHQYPGDSFCIVADLHTLAYSRRHDPLTDLGRQCALDYLALGVDPNLSSIYRQSDVPQVCELLWILACITQKARLDRSLAHRLMPKDTRRGTTLGVFLSPVLLTADVLALRGTDMPFGPDHSLLFELVRETAHAFNRAWRPIFPDVYSRNAQPDSMPGTDGHRMTADRRNAIPLFWADEDALLESVRSIVTGPTPTGAPVDPDRTPIFEMYRLVASADDADDMREAFTEGKLSYRDAKKQLADRLQIYFAPFRRRREALRKDMASIDDVLAAGAERAREEVAATMEAVRDCIGLPYRNLSHF
jgi:tryptophanyl-tRNA synthetase